MIVRHATTTIAAVHEVSAAQTEVVPVLVVSHVKVIGFAQVVKTRTLHGEMSATVARSPKQMAKAAVREAEGRPKEVDSKVVTTIVAEETDVVAAAAAVVLTAADQ